MNLIDFNKVEGLRVLDLDSLATFFKAKELFSKLKVEPVEAKIVYVRCDGRNFKKLTERLGLEPFDNRMRAIFIKTIQEFFEVSGFSVDGAYHVSDEINYILTHLPFNGRIEKINSVFASLTSSIFTLKLIDYFGEKVPVSFDSRIVPMNGLDEATIYLVWRQLDGFRNFLNQVAYNVLKSKDIPKRELVEKLKGMKGHELVEMIEREYKPLADFPNWQKWGDLVFYIEQSRPAVNKLTGEEVVAKRRKLVFESFDFTKDSVRLNNILRKIYFKELA